jgi:NTP pyrophosphatase (non-canonical NTP hydrolase)
MNRLDDIRQWATDRNLILGSTPPAQMLKLTEEVGELAAALARGYKAAAVDGLGDAVVVLTILAAQIGVDLEDCIEHAWHQIKDRKGRMIDGIFVKDAE